MGKEGMLEGRLMYEFRHLGSRYNVVNSFVVELTYRKKAMRTAWSILCKVWHSGSGWAIKRIV